MNIKYADRVQMAIRNIEDRLLTPEEAREAWLGISGSPYELKVETWHNSTGTVPMKLEKTEPMKKFIRCPYCGTRNPNLSTIYYCQACGGPLEE